MTAVANGLTDSGFDVHVGIEVLDDAKYQQYRDGMRPILLELGGDFRYDFRVETTLRNASDHPINRVFVIGFPDEEARDAFFGDERYKAIRAEFFDASVGGVTTIAQYAR